MVESLDLIAVADVIVSPDSADTVLSASTDSTDDVDSVRLRLHADQYSQSTVTPDLADSVPTCIC